ncbi:Proton/glutamate-aspartate symporter [Candidatus Hartigia pinicola]|nr:Proton/glutamate-aspartate symporter [Candidatus Hartigia pinicola]
MTANYTSTKKLFKFGLGWQILLALILGVIVGGCLNENAEYKNWLILNFLSPAGQIFIQLIKMIVIPIVISTLIVGVAGVGNTKKLGSLGFKTIVYFEFITTIAIIVGISFANIFQPGVGIDMSKLTQFNIVPYEKINQEVENHPSGIINTILTMVPSNVFSAMVSGDILPVIFFAIIFGLGLSALSKNKKQPLLDIIQAFSETMFRVTNIIMMYAPIGVFSLIALTVANFGFESLVPLLKLVFLVHCAIIFFIIVVLGLVARYFTIKIFTLMKILKEELLLAYSTASSETVLPRIMDKMERYGASKSVTSFVIPIGYSFNLDGSTLYQSIAAIFIAQLYNIELSIWREIILVCTLMITSKGIAGVPGVSFIVLLSTLDSVGIPLEGLAFIAGIDRILDMARTALNVIGNALAVLVIAKWERNYDAEKARAYEKHFHCL